MIHEYICPYQNLGVSFDIHIWSEKVKMAINTIVQYQIVFTQ